MASIIDVDECALGDECYFQQRDYKKAAQCYRQAVDKGNVIAMYMMGLCYYNGTGVDECITKAVMHWENAFMKGEVRYSPYELGCCYFFGEGVKENEEDAFRLWSISASNGHKGAMLEVGNSYFNGNGVKRDLTRANAFWKKSAEQPCKKAE